MPMLTPHHIKCTSNSLQPNHRVILGHRISLDVVPCIALFAFRRSCFVVNYIAINYAEICVAQSS